MNSTMIVLRLIHILGGVFWAGSLFFVANFLFPGARASGPAGGAVMQQVMVVRKFPVVAAIASILTILSGAGMYWHNNTISAGAFARSTPGMAYGIGAITALIAFGVAAGMVGPNGEKLTKLQMAIQSAGKPPTSDQLSAIAGFQARLALGLRIGAMSLGVTVVAMAIARYL